MSLRTTLLALATGLGLAQSASAVTIAWEDEFASGAIIASGTQVTSSGVTLDFTHSVVQDNTGGNPDLFLFSGIPDFFTVNGGTQGGHTGYALFAFDNQNDDPDDYLTFTITFSVAVGGLQFSILDVDSGGGNSWDDGVEITYNGGTNLRSNPTLFSFPGAAPAVTLDNEPGYEGFEAVNNTSVAPTSNNGNIDVDFGLNLVTDVTIRYFSTDDATPNPAGQLIGLSDIAWLSAVPEPGTGALLALGLALLAASRRRAGAQRRS